MKSLLKLLILGLVITSCSTDDDIIPIEDRTIISKSYIFCSQDNVINVNGEWISSVDLDTYEAANDILAVYIADGGLYMESLTFDIADIQIRNLNIDASIDGSEAFVYIPNISYYLLHTDWFYIDIKFYENE